MRNDCGSVRVLILKCRVLRQSMAEDMSAASVNLLPLAGEKVMATSDKCTPEES